MKTAHDFFAAFRWKVALNVRDDENEHAEQHGDFQHIVDEKLNAAANSPGHIKTEQREQVANYGIQPFHSKHLVLKEQPYGLQNFHNGIDLSFLNHIVISKKVDALCQVKAISHQMAFIYCSSLYPLLCHRGS